MSFAGGVYFTNLGRALQAKAQIGTELNFTRLGVGDGQLGGQDISELTDLINEVMSLSITELRVLTGGKASVRGVLSNQGLTTGFYWREVGLFATDPDLGEILYCYGNAAALAEYIPAGGGSEILEKHVAIVSIVGNAASVTATIEQSLVYATQQDLAAHLADYKQQPVYGGTTTNVGNAYAISSPAITALVWGWGVCIRINADATGAATLNWCGTGDKAMKKPNGSSVTNLKSGGIYSFRYDAVTDSFILQGEGGSGNATAGDLLSGKTASTDVGDITGTMINKVGSATIITPSTSDQAIPQGYYGGAAGDGKVLGDADLVTGNIKKNANIFGVTGKSTVVDVSDSTFDNAAALLNTKTAYYLDGNKGTGTMVPRGAVVITPGTSNQTISDGYHNGSGYVVGDTDLTAGNIKSGVNIFGVAGSYSAKRYYLTTVTPDSSTMTFYDSSGNSTTLHYISLSSLGLSFTPTMAWLYRSSSSTREYTWVNTNFYSMGVASQMMKCANGDMRLDGTQAYMTPSAIRIPAYTYNCTYTLLLIE